jgi:hypothetical protein
MPYPLNIEDSSRLCRRHRRREELLECFRLLREMDANQTGHTGTRTLDSDGQMQPTGQRPPLQNLEGFANNQRQQQDIPPHYHLNATGSSFANNTTATTYSTAQLDTKKRCITFAHSTTTHEMMQHETKRRRVTFAPLNEAKRRRVTFAPSVPADSTAQDEKKPRRNTFAPSSTQYHTTGRRADRYSQVMLEDQRRRNPVQVLPLPAPGAHFSSAANNLPSALPSYPRLTECYDTATRTIPFGAASAPLLMGPPPARRNSRQQQHYSTQMYSVGTSNGQPFPYAHAGQPTYPRLMQQPPMVPFPMVRGTRKQVPLLPHAAENRRAIVSSVLLPPSAHDARAR